MELDIRIPIAILFLIYGSLLAAFGLLSGPSTHPFFLGMNLNLCWGIVLLAFGALMLALGLRKRRPSFPDPRR